MADIQLDNEGNPSTPASGSTIIFVNSTNKELATIDDTGSVKTTRPLTNAAAVTTLTAPAVETTLTGSTITVPTQLLKIGTTFMWRFGFTKTNSGTTGPIWRVHFGTAGTSADATLLTFTQANAQTAVADTGWCEIHASMLTVGSGTSATMEGVQCLTHTLTATGISTVPSEVKVSTSSGFDSTVAGSIMSASCNPGTTCTFTFTHISVICTNV